MYIKCYSVAFSINLLRCNLRKIWFKIREVSIVIFGFGKLFGNEGYKYLNLKSNKLISYIFLLMEYSKILDLNNQDDE